VKPAVESKRMAVIGALLVGGFGIYWYYIPYPWLGIAVGLFSGLFTFYLLSSRKMESARRFMFIGINALVITAIVLVILQMGAGDFMSWAGIHEKEYYLPGQTLGVQNFPCTRDVPQVWLGRAAYITDIGIWQVTFPSSLGIFLTTLIPYVVVGLLFGRGVCGWLCPFGGLTEVFVTGKKIRWNLNALKRRITSKEGFSYAGLKEWVKDTKYALLITVILLSAFLSFPLVCVFCPVFWLDPIFILWIMLLFIVIFAVILPIMTKHRWWCLICPIGAVFGLINKISFFRIRIDSKKCIKCYDCIDECRMYAMAPESVEQSKHLGENCIRCGRCIEACPEEAIDMYWLGTNKKVRSSFLVLMVIAALAFYIWFIIIVIDVLPRLLR